jgi:D-amino peptidase
MSKYFISFDYEGLAGVTNWKETMGNAHFNHLATQQINAFLTGLYRTDPQAEVVIADSHADGCNLIWEELVGSATVVKGYPRARYMVEALDASFDQLLLFGYHGPVGSGGVMDHTYSGGCIYRITLNGQIMDEGTINALMAAHFGVKLGFVFADDVGVNWLRKQIDPALAAVTSKRAISRFAAQVRPYSDVLADLTVAGEQVPQQAGCLPALPRQFNCTIDLADTTMGYAAAIIPGCNAVSPRTIRFCADDALEFYRYLMTVIMVAGSVRNLYT